MLNYTAGKIPPPLSGLSFSRSLSHSPSLIFSFSHSLYPWRYVRQQVHLETGLILRVRHRYVAVVMNIIAQSFYNYSSSVSFTLKNSIGLLTFSEFSKHWIIFRTINYNRDASITVRSKCKILIPRDADKEISKKIETKRTKTK